MNAKKFLFILFIPYIMQTLLVDSNSQNITFEEVKKRIEESATFSLTSLDNQSLNEIKNNYEKVYDGKSIKYYPRNIEDKRIDYINIEKYSWYYSARVKSKNGEDFYAKITKGQLHELEKICTSNNVLLHIEKNSFFSVLYNIVLNNIGHIIFILFLFLLSRRSLVDMSQNDFGEQNKVTSCENFSLVAGLKIPKEELYDIVEYLKNPKKYLAINAKMPKGILLVGPPGNGKTTLARALAGESKANFFAVSASEFDEVFVGMGSARVRSIFDAASKNSPSIIFIDEIDSLGNRKYMRGGNTSQTLNQILSCIDGFNKKEGVIILGATNRENDIDPALLRPGRFDRKININLPNKKERKEVINLLFSKIKNINIDVEYFSRITMGMSMAEIASMVNEAKILSIRNNENISSKIMEEAHWKIMAGSKNEEIDSEEERKYVSYHEAGHALVAAAYNFTIPKVSIIPRRNAAGITIILPKKEEGILTVEESLERISYLYAGTLAEQIGRGYEIKSFGASNDIMKATQYARNIVLTGNTKATNTCCGEYAYPKDSYSENSLRLIDEHVEEILQKCKDEAKKIIDKNLPYLHDLAGKLLEKKELYEDEIKSLVEHVSA